MFSAWDFGSWTGSLGAILLLFGILAIDSLILASVAVRLGKAGETQIRAAVEARPGRRRAA